MEQAAQIALCPPHRLSCSTAIAGWGDEEEERLSAVSAAERGEIVELLLAVLTSEFGPQLRLDSNVKSREERACVRLMPSDLTRLGLEGVAAVFDHRMARQRPHGFAKESLVSLRSGHRHEVSSTHRRNTGASAHGELPLFVTSRTANDGSAPASSGLPHKAAER